MRKKCSVLVLKSFKQILLNIHKLQFYNSLLIFHSAHAYRIFIFCIDCESSCRIIIISQNLFLNDFFSFIHANYVTNNRIHLFHFFSIFSNIWLFVYTRSGGIRKNTIFIHIPCAKK